MTRFDGEYSLLFVMPDICRSLYMKLRLDEQKRINREIRETIRNNVDIQQLGYWVWDVNKISADADGFKTEEDVRGELNQLVSTLGLNGLRLAVSDDEGLILGGSKGVQCGQDFHFEYPLRIDNGGEPETHLPWIITSGLYPQIVFEVRVSMHWMGPAGYVLEPGETSDESTKIVSASPRKDPANEPVSRVSEDHRASGRMLKRKQLEHD